MIQNEKYEENQLRTFFAQNNAKKIIVRLFTIIKRFVKIIITINYVIFDWGVKE